MNASIRANKRENVQELTPIFRSNKQITLYLRNYLAP